MVFTQTYNTTATTAIRLMTITKRLKIVEERKGKIPMKKLEKSKSRNGAYECTGAD